MTQGTEAITTIYFVLMALLALLVVIAVLVGVRKKRRRTEAQREVAAHAQEAGIEPASPSGSEMLAAPPADITPLPITHDLVPLHPLDDEPIPAAVTADGTATTIAADAVTHTDVAHEAPSPADGPVTQLKGLGPKVAARLGELGIDRVGQIAALDDGEAAALDAELGPFAGRLTRDRWVEQARLLAAGDRAGFESVFGKL